MQRKHKVHKNVLLALRTNNGKINFRSEENKFGLETEMIAQYVRLKMSAMPTLQVQQFVLYVGYFIN